MARKRKSPGEMPDVGAAVVLTGTFDMFGYREAWVDSPDYRLFVTAARPG